jgi:modulator of FtsH protease
MNPVQRQTIPYGVATGASGEVNKVLRNTYGLLSVTLLFSAVMAGVSVVMNVPSFVSLICSLGALALVWFVLPRTAHSAAGLGVVFAITGMLGFGLGPMLSRYLGLPNGGELIMMAMGGTGVIFMALSSYVLVTRKDFSFMGGFLFVGMIVAVLAGLVGWLFSIPGLSIAVSAMIVLLMSGMILWETSNIVNGGETNYINATVSLYLSIYNLFVSLLQLLGISGGSED